MTGQNQFHVEPSSLTGYAGQITRNAGFVSQISRYVSANAGKTDQLRGPLQEFATAAVELMNWQVDLLNRMQQELTTTATALSATADNYTHTDQANATRLDQAYSAEPESRSGQHAV